MTRRPRHGPAARIAALLVVFFFGATADAGDAPPLQQAASSAQGEKPPPASSPRAERIVWRWKWHQGVRYRLELPFEQYWIGPETGPIREAPIEKRLAFIGTIGARVQVDATGYGATRGLEDVDPGIEMRRLRFGTRGDFYFLKHVSYAIDVDVIGTGFEVGDTYLWWRDVPYLQRVKIGNFTPPLSVENLTSTRDILFMETALPVEALAPARSSGLEVGGPVLAQRATWALALVRTIGTTDQGDKSKAGGRAVARATWLPQDDPSSRRLTHLGLGASILFDAEDVRYRTRPESHLAPALADTGELRAADRSTQLGLELLHVHGRWVFMSEALGATVAGRTDHRFWGLYGLAMCTLTGETQPYDRTSGILGRFLPSRPFSWRDGAWGALRVGGRVSHIDLTDGRVAGGRDTNLTANLTWVLNRYFLFKLETGLAFVRDRPDAGNLYFVQTRFQIDFY